jgi:hypothetical protein
MVIPETVGTHRLRFGEAGSFDIYEDLGGGSYNNWKAGLLDPEAGVIVVDSITPSTISGTFAVTARWYGGPGASSDLSVTNGRFQISSYCQAQPPAC